MSLHGLLSVTMGVPNVDETAAYYAEFGLAPEGDGWFSTLDAGRQLRIVHAPTRRLIEMRVGVDDPDDLEPGRREPGPPRPAARADRTGAGDGRAGHRHPGPARGRAADQAGSVVTATPYNGPGRIERPGNRAPGFMPPKTRSARASSATPFSAPPTTAADVAFFTEGLGFKVSDRIAGVGAFMRCSTDHHNVLVLAAPVNFLHHTSWQVDDIDDVGRGAHAMLEGQPGAPRLGPRPALRGVELLLVPQGPGRQLLRVLLGHGLHPRGPAVDPGGPRRRPQPVRLGPAAPALVPAPRRPRRHDDRRPRTPLTRPPGAGWAHGSEVGPGERSCVGWFRMHRSFCRFCCLGKPSCSTSRRQPAVR